jgi:hypothetical protein
MHPGAGGGGYRPPPPNGVDAGLLFWPGFRSCGLVLVWDIGPAVFHERVCGCLSVDEKDEGMPVI